MAQLLTTFGSRADFLGSMANAERPAANSTINGAELERRLPSAEAMRLEFNLGNGDPKRLLDEFPEQQQAFEQRHGAPHWGTWQRQGNAYGCALTSSLCCSHLLA